MNQISIKHIDDMAEALQLSSLLNLAKPINDKDYATSYNRGKVACADSGHVALPYTRNANWRLCAWMSGWAHELERHHNIDSLSLHEAANFRLPVK